MPDSLDPRRRPTQARGQARRDAILDAAAALLDVHGYKGTTTKRIAAASGASVGAVYDYFPNKDALFVTLLERFQHQLGETIAAAVFDARGWAAQVDAGIDAFYRFYRDTPGYQTLWLGTQLVDELREAGRAYAESTGAFVATAISAVAPHLDAAERSRVAAILVHLAGAGATAALQGPEAEREPLMTEVKLMARLYLEQRLRS